MPQGEFAQVSRRPTGAAETASANRRWWDTEADTYYREHGGFLGDDGFVWGPEGWTEAELGLLGELAGRRVLEIGGGAGQCARWVADRGAQVVSSDLSAGMIRTGLDLNRRLSLEQQTPALPLVQADGRQLPFARGSFDTVFTSYGVIPFVADAEQVLAEVARVLKPGGRFVFSTTHPVRWALPDAPGPEGLTVASSYFDRSPYVEETAEGHALYVEHHRTLGDRVREIVAAGLRLVDLVEPEWPSRNLQTWGGWSPLRGRLVPGTAIFVTERPAGG